MSEGASRVWTVPNIISLVRLAGVPLFLWLVLGPEQDAFALALLMVAGFTDYLDGWLARRLDQYSQLGEILDPQPVHGAILGVTAPMVSIQAQILRPGRGSGPARVMEGRGS